MSEIKAGDLVRIRATVRPCAGVYVVEHVETSEDISQAYIVCEGMTGEALIQHRVTLSALELVEWGEVGE